MYINMYIHTICIRDCTCIYMYALNHHLSSGLPSSFKPFSGVHVCLAEILLLTIPPILFANISSMSSDEDDSSNRQREFQTSFEEDGAKPSHRAALYMTTSPNTLSKITAKASDDSDKMDISSPYNACECVQLAVCMSIAVPFFQQHHGKQS